MEQIILKRSQVLTQDLEDFMRSALFNYGASAHEERLKQMVERVMTSELLARILGSDNAWPELPVSGTDDEGVIVEGFADLVIREDNELTIIDYKTNLELTSEKIDKYTSQLNAYSNIIEAATGLKVKQKMLWHVLPEKIEEVLI
jgi:ATP-dependent exoDNAse (exonuclease V) beta subunit